MSGNTAHNIRRMNLADPSQDRLIQPLAAAERLGLVGLSKTPHREVLKMVRRGELQGRRIGRWTLVVESSVDRLISGGARA